MSLTTDMWIALYAAKVAVTGTTELATVGARAVNKRVILSQVPTDPAFSDGTTSEAGTYEAQMLASDFSSNPARNDAFSANGNATGKILFVQSWESVDGIFRLTVGDRA